MPSNTSKNAAHHADKNPDLRVVGGTQAVPDSHNIQDVVDRLQLHLNAQLSLCDALESFADKLPENVTNDECLVYAQSVYPAVHKAHKFEEQVLFPMLTELAHNDEALKQTLERLHAEHWEDESYAEEIAQGLKDFAADRTPERANTLGYMVRGFFEGLRRHIAFEREHLLPMLDMR